MQDLQDVLRRAIAEDQYHTLQTRGERGLCNMENEAEYEREKKKLVAEYEKKVANVTKVKEAYGKDLEAYKKCIMTYHNDMDALKLATKNEDYLRIGFLLEQMDDTVENIHRIHVKLNEQLCLVYNTLPG